ncbi:hypothetical protein PAXRUDRAFT_28646 [Paxillus rubicundulus Ve08.2h10]|uniref:Uncharacterized protein n=1 Tax=Paxillus rubicundulus Ve08.2h10 TaxID=930991 RepID=A0A0D0D415_9AGAM|nr:hypothetical protein PAXRUDRAFT_28646 [Paxillus rubicundulus Ve08.2h10]
MDAKYTSDDEQYGRKVAQGLDSSGIEQEFNTQLELHWKMDATVPKGWQLKKPQMLDVLKVKINSVTQSQNLVVAQGHSRFEMEDPADDIEPDDVFNEKGAESFISDDKCED